MHWRLIVDAGPRLGVENMAIDRALLESVKAGGRPSLRFYRWSPPCLSLGRNQPASPALGEAAARRGIDVVRRPTGGAAVLHDHELTYSVAVPVGGLGSPRETYRALNRALVAGLRRLGVAAAVAGEPDGSVPRESEDVVAPGGSGVVARGADGVMTRGADGVDTVRAPAEGEAGENSIAGVIQTPRALTGPCFVEAAPGEVVVGGRKLVGSAQRREGRVLLQHGSLLLGGDQGVVAELLAEAAAGGGSALDANPASAVPGVATLDAVLGEAPRWDTLVDALVAGFEEALGTALAPGELTREEGARARALEAELGADAWIWRL